MNYSGNITDWHQYNSVQANINEVTSTDHNVNTNRLAFIPSVSPSSLNVLNTEGYKKYQNESSFTSRHFPPMNNISNGPTNTDNFPLPSMVQMQGYIGQYSPTVNRNSVMDNVKGPIDIRNGSMNTFSDDYRYRNNHMVLPGQNSHLNGSNINTNTPATSIGSRNNSVCAVSSVRQGSTSFIPCKALCCNPNTNMGYQQWDKYGTYQSTTPYRENVRLSGYHTENRQYSEHNFRKDNFENKEMLGSIIPNTDPRRNFPEYKYNKDSIMHRGCPPPSGMMQNYPIQNYNYATECQKYTYPVKEYPKTNNMGLQDPTMFKHQEQNYITQQKYNAKQGQYNTGNVLPKTVPSSNVTVDASSSTQNSYYTSQFIRNIPSEFSRTCQKAFDNPQQVTAMQSTSGSSSRYHLYQQKIAMQRYSMENHLRELARIPGYQSHPKYKESVLRYREILKMQQLYGCQAALQHPLRIATTAANTVPSINLQFDQNGVLINSNCLSDGFPKAQHTLNSMIGSKHLEKQGKEHNLSNENNLHSKQSINHSQKEHVPSLYPNNFQNPDQFLLHKSSEQTDFKIQESTDEGLNSHNVDTITTQQKTSKDFADKPDLDVRQFLANWDASEDEDDSNSNLPDVVLSNSTPLVVVEYESIDGTSKIPHNMDIKGSISCSKKHEKVTDEYPDSSDSPSHGTENLKNLSECKSKDITKSQNIIHCINNSTDEIPTIHIVDNLQINNILEVSNEQIIETLENQGSIPFYEENVNPREEITSCENKGDTVVKEVDRCKLSDQYNTETLNKDTYITTDTLSDKSRKSLVQDKNKKLSALETTSKNNSDGKITNLQKQNSFASEESHNTDDISLPELPTTECTPISTTLNTPIHSDSEEPSGRVSSISSNPIEIIQNSPIISFTHSPIKIGSYEHLDDTGISKENALLQFNLEEVNQSNNNNINVFENTIAPNNFNKVDNLCKSDIDETCRSDISQTSPNKNLTILHMKKVESKELNVKAPDICVVSVPEYESEVVSIDTQTNSTEYLKNANIEKFNTDECQSITHPMKHINHKTPTSIETSKCILKNKLSENKQQHIINIDTIQNSDKHPEVNVETKKQAKYLLETKLQQGVPKDNNAISLTSGENEVEEHTLVRHVEKSTLLDIKNVTSIANINVYTSDPNKSQSVNTISTSTKCMDILMSTKFNSKSPQNACTIKESDRDSFSKDLQSKLKNQELTKNSNIHLSSVENSDLCNVEILSTLHKTCSTSNAKNNTELESDIIHGKEDNNEFIFATQEKSVSTVIAKRVYNQLQKNDELCKINADIGIKCIVEEENTRNKIIEEKKLEPSQKEFHINTINMINNIQKQNSTEYIATNNSSTSSDKCIDTQQCDSVTEDFHALEKNTDLRNKTNSRQTSSSVAGICSITSEKLDSEQQYSISKSSTTKNVNSDFEIQVTNVNLKFTDNDIRKEIVTLRDKRQENLKNCSDGIKIEINVLCAEHNAKEKLLQQDLINVDSEVMEQPNEVMCGSKSTCLSNVKEFNILPHEKLETEKEVNKAGEIVSHEQSESTDIICNKNVENTVKVQEEPLSLIVRNKILPVCKENPHWQEFSNDNEILSKYISKRSQNDEKDIDNYIEIVRGAKSMNIFNSVKKQCTSSSSIDHLRHESICCSKNDNLLNITSQENEPSNVIYSSAAFSSSNVNYMQNSTNVSSFAEQIPTFSSIQKSKIKEPFSVSYKYKDRKDEDDNSCDKNDGTPNIVTIHVKTDNVNNEKFSELDFTNFDLFSNESNKSNDNESGKWRRPITPIMNQTLEECDLYGSTGGYVNPIFTNIEESNNRKEVPMYRTKDGKITYSPNPKALFLENRERTNCTMKEYSPYKYYNYPKMYSFLKKNKDVNNYKEKALLDSNDTKITWSESAAKSFPEYSNENDNIQKNSHCMKYQRSLNLKHYHPKAGKQYDNVSDNGIHKEYNKYHFTSKYGEQKQHSNEDNHTTYKDYFKSEMVTDKSENYKENLKDVFDDNTCLEEKSIKRTEMMELSKVYSITCHNTRNNNYIHKNSHNDASSFAPKNTSLEKINLNEICDIKLKYCDTIKESSVPYVICDQTSDRSSLNQGNNLISERSNTIMEIDKEFKPNIDRLKSTELHLEENCSKDIRCCINNIIKHDSSSEISKYFSGKVIDPNIAHIETDSIYVDTKKSELRASSEISKCKKHHENNYTVKCEVHSDENIDSFEEDFDNTRDILKYTNTENILISKKDVLLTEKLHVECSDPLRQLNSTKQKEEIVYNSDESNSDIENTNFSLESEVSKVNEDENLNQQIAEANVFYAESNTSISEKEWKRLPSNCFKHDIQIIESDVINSNNSNSKVHVIQGESIHISQAKRSEISKTIVETVIAESSFNELGNNDCRNPTFVKKDHRYDTPFSEAGIEPQIIHTNQDKNKEILSEPIICEKSIDLVEEINTDKDTENKNVEDIISLINSVNNSKTKSIANSQNFLVNNNNEVNTIKQSSIEQDVEIINRSQNNLKIFNSRGKKLQGKQFNDSLYCFENKINIDTLYSSSKQQRNCSTKAYNTTELNVSTLTSQKYTNMIDEIIINDKENKMEEECSLSPPDITTTAYIDIDYLSSISDCNVNDKISSGSVTKENETTAKSKPELSPQPKIPKMIIRNTKSRSTTPVAEEVLDTLSGFPTCLRNKTKHSTFIITNEGNNKIRSDSDSETSLEKYNLNKSRVPKMKIKLNEKSSKEDIKDKNVEISFKRKDIKKTIPKVKIKKIRTEAKITRNDQTQSSLKVMEVKTPDISDETRKREKIPKLKLRKNQDVILCSEIIQKRPHPSTIDLTVKKYKSDKNEIRFSQKCSNDTGDNSFMSGHEIKSKSLSYISEKIPKVIIKRASASAEFKCEFSEGDSKTVINSAKWQPEVKLQRSQLLDDMVKDWKYCRISKAYITQKCIDIISSHGAHKLVQGYRFREKRHSKSNKFYRSSSVSDLYPAKCEKNEVLDHSCSKSKLGTKLKGVQTI
ncbi:hypothetical protein KPH14_008483 [Odynerus spinipes]|uniref:Uncharacterized protein n=1 Tax=Odynerus spinipes TaxID=1348599 RepID=A0AAD9RF44_9HYME|nr:hypothetical protein KPH14_008483 [Odynerus spinipes]